MKVAKSQLRKILIQELGDIISEQVTIEVAKQLKKQKPILDTIQEDSVFDNLMAPHTEDMAPTPEFRNYTGDPAIDSIINEVSVPNNYYATAGPSQNGPRNPAFKPTQLKQADTVEGNVLNDLENTDFSSYI